MPATHCEQDDEPEDDEKPAGHSVQTASAVAVHAVDAKEPALQVLQAAHGSMPVAALKVRPATHGGVGTQAAAPADHW